MSTPTAPTLRQVHVGSAEWQVWLEQARTFAFTDSSGTFTARRERDARGLEYWKAYRRRAGRLQRAYLGKSADLTLERLAAAARGLDADASTPRGREPLNPDGHTNTRSAKGRDTELPRGLPSVTTSLLGRRRDVAAARDLLEEGHARLLTLTGPGGTGKTRLALAVAQEFDAAAAFSDGVWFVDLSPLEDAQVVLPTIARLLGVRDQAGHPVAITLAASLRRRRLLLVVDNCEHVLDAAPEISSLLDACPGLCVLATSREPLRVRWEQEFPVPPLPLPYLGYGESVATLASNPAVALFVERAAAVVPGFVLSEHNRDAVSELCVRLDGLPLAIELAAAHVRLLPPHELLARLDRRLDVLRSRLRDAPARHHTLRDALDWSHELLTNQEQVLFRRLAAFAGGCSLQAVEFVGGSEALETAGSLLDKSLLIAFDDHDERRFRMLETVREYARERLDASGEMQAVQDRHSRWVLWFAEQASDGLRGLGQVRWMHRMTAELDNVRAALRWCIGAGALERAARLLYLTASYWWIRGLYSEGRHWGEEVLAEEHRLPPPALAQARFVTGEMAFLQGHASRAVVLLEDALKDLREAEDLAGAGMALGMLAFAASQHDLGQAADLLSQSTAAFRTARDTWGEAWALQGQGGMRLAGGELAAAHDLYEASLRLSRERGDLRGIAQALDGLAFVALNASDAASAAAHWHEGLPLSYQVGHLELLVYGLRGLALVALLCGQATRAARLLGAAERIFERAGMDDWPIRRPLSVRAYEEGRLRLGAGEFEAALQLGRLLSLDEAMLEAEATAAAALPPPAHEAAKDPTAQLTQREREVAKLIAQGLTSPQIAELLVISAHTADAHADNIRGKLGLRSRAAIAAWAAEHGLHP